MLEDVVARVRSNFRDNGCPAEVETGPQFIAQHGHAPRVVFVPGKEPDTFEGPIAVQQRPNVDPKKQPYQNPRSLATRWSGAEVHIWAAGIKQVDAQLQNAADRAALGALVNETYRAIYYAAGIAFFRNVSGAVKTEPGLVTYGLVYTLRVQFAIPVLEIPWVENAPFGPNAADKTGNTWTNLDDVKPKIEESFNPTGSPVIVIQP